MGNKAINTYSSIIKSNYFKFIFEKKKGGKMKYLALILGFLTTFIIITSLHSASVSISISGKTYGLGSMGVIIGYLIFIGFGFILGRILNEK